MSSVKPVKPLLSAILSIIALASFVFISTDYLVSDWSFTDVSASATKWGIILGVGAVWLLVQVFMIAPPESSRLSLTISGSILWLGLLLFFNFDQKGFGGPVGFFALVGGLVVVIAWTHYLADEF
jgi:hypothetical protein